MATASPEVTRPHRGGRPLDPDRPDPDTARPSTGPGGSDAGTDAAAASDAASSTGGAGAGASGAAAGSKRRGRGDRPPGLKAQLKFTADALVGLVRAHAELAKAEAAEIQGEVAHAAGFLAAALAALLLLAVFLPIVTMLFLGEWLFGSIGWGVLLGSEMLLSVALTAVLVALRLDGYRRAVIIATIIGLITFVVLGASLPHLLWTRIAESTNLAVDPLVEPLLVAMAIVGAIGAILGLVLGARATGFGGAVVGLFGGLVAGGLLGAFLAVDFGWRVGAALGFAAWYATYMGVLAAGVAAKGIDPEQIKARFWPQVTIDTTMETIEWAKQKNPLGPRS